MCVRVCARVCFVVHAQFGTKGTPTTWGSFPFFSVTLPSPFPFVSLNQCPHTFHSVSVSASPSILTLPTFASAPPAPSTPPSEHSLGVCYSRSFLFLSPSLALSLYYQWRAKLSSQFSMMSDSYSLLAAGGTVSTHYYAVAPTCVCKIMNDPLSHMV